MADNVTVKDPVAAVAERALKKINLTKVTGWNANKNVYVFVAPYDCRIDQVSLTSDIAVAANDTNYYSFQVQNVTKSLSLLSAVKTTRVTGGQAITANAPYDLSPNQNLVVSDGDVLQLQVTETGVATDLTTGEVVATVEYT